MLFRSPTSIRPIKQPRTGLMPIHSLKGLRWTGSRVRNFINCLAGLLMVLILGTLPSFGQEDAPTEMGRYQVDIGIGNQIRLGRWNPIRVTVEDAAATTPTHFEATTIDGDGYGITYYGELSGDETRPDRKQGWIRFGRIIRSAEVKLFSNDQYDQPLQSITVPIEASQLASSVQPLAISIANDAVNAAFAETAIGLEDAKDKIIVTESSIESLPIDRLGLDCVGTLMLVVDQPSVVEKLSEAQVEAIDNWVRNGGRFILSVSADSVSVVQGSGLLKRFCPGQPKGVSALTNSSSLESFVDSRDQLLSGSGESIMSIELESPRGIVLVKTDQKPLLIREPVELGEVMFATFDLSAPKLTSWTGYTNLIQKIVNRSQQKEVEISANKPRGTISHFGYTDLLGQLRVPLDQFSSVGFVKFRWIALLIALYILIIGPVDYFLLKKLNGRMEFTWLTFPIFSLLFCGLAIFLSQSTRPDQIQINQLEIVDIDVETGTVRGSVFANLYCPDGVPIDVDLDRQHSLGFDVTERSVIWSGLPGDGLGGMKTLASPQGPVQRYRQEVSLQNGDFNTHMTAVPIQVSSSRSVSARWWSKLPEEIRSRIRYRSRLDRITGQIKNPFDFELKNCRLFYANWAYVLDEPLGPGESFDIQTDSKERDAKNHLTQKRAKVDEETRSVTTKWNPTEKRLSRLADIMMFYESSGGQSYTNMTHGFDDSLDLSSHVLMNRAILVGEVESQGAALLLDQGQTDAEQDQRTTVVRIIFPVQETN